MCYSTSSVRGSGKFAFLGTSLNITSCLREESRKSTITKYLITDPKVDTMSLEYVKTYSWPLLPSRSWESHHPGTADSGRCARMTNYDSFELAVMI